MYTSYTMKIFTYKFISLFYLFLTCHFLYEKSYPRATQEDKQLVIILIMSSLYKLHSSQNAPYPFYV